MYVHEEDKYGPLLCSVQIMWVLHVRVIKLLQHIVQNTGIRAILSFWRHPFTAEDPMDLNFSKSVLLRYDVRVLLCFS